LRCRPHERLHGGTPSIGICPGTALKRRTELPRGALSLLGHFLTAGDKGKLACTAMSLINSFFLFPFCFFWSFSFFSLMLSKKSQTAISNRTDLSKGFDNSSLPSPF